VTRIVLLLAALVALPGVARAAAPVVAERLVEGEKIVVDGVADEEAWARAVPVEGFVGSAPTEGFDPAGDTSVHVLTDATHLYFYFRARFDEPTRVRGYLAERENVNQDDQVAVYIDPFGDGRRAYVFWFNALGVQQDMLYTITGQWNGAWDAVFKSVGKIVEGGYDVEVAIPFRSLRFPKDSDRSWRVLFKRKFTARLEYASYPALRADVGHELLQYAELQGVEPGRSGIGLEMLPTVAARTGQDRNDEDELKWRKPGFPDTVDPGFGLKWQLTPSLALNATVNPDFSQIEADPNQIDNNLRFALWLPERRPFFLEGSELFSGSLLHTRSIVDPIYGVKFSGKQGRVSMAVLHALDEAPAASVVGERDTPGFREEDVEDSMSLVTHAETRFDLGTRSYLAVAYADKELVRDGSLVGSYHGSRLSGRFALDEHSQIDAAFGYSEAGAAGGERLHGPTWYAGYSRNERLHGFGAWTSGSGEDWRNENGFSTRPGVASVGAWGNKKFEFDGPFPWLRVGGSAGIDWEQLATGAPVPSSSYVLGWAQVRAPALTDLYVQASRWDQLYEGQDFQGGWLWGSVSSNALEWLQASVSGGGGESVRYDDATQTLERTLNASVNVRGFRRLTVGLGTTINWLGREGERMDRLVIYRTRWVLGITRALSVRAIVQGRNLTYLDEQRAVTGVDSGLDLSLLVTLVPSPGTSIHVGFGERWDWTQHHKPETQQRDLFLKGSLLIRL
jgi:hypothetical protein